jgi:indolepyruvate ferredoxin oxidoreductase alpha subunit
MVEQGFELSEASSTPVMLELRIRACHVHGTFATKANREPAISRKRALADPAFDYGKIVLPPSSYAQEKQKVEVRWPKAAEFVRTRRLNEVFAGTLDDVGIITQGGLYNMVIRALQQLGLADAFGASRIPIYCLNVTYPLIPEEIVAFCTGKHDVLVVEEGQPAFIEDAILAALRRADVNATKIHGKGCLPIAGEYTGEVLLDGMAKFVERAAPAGVDVAQALAVRDRLLAPKMRAAELLGGPVPGRPPGFCIGCPERPVFSAMKLLERESGAFHVSADIGCHLFSTLPPFNIGNTVLGYGLGLASNSAIDPLFGRRTVTIMGDGGFWHNGLASGVANAVFNKDDGILVIMNNGYTSATGTQNIPSSPHQPEQKMTGMSIEQALKGVGVQEVRRVTTYKVAQVAAALKEAMASPFKGLKVIIAESECQLEKQRRLRPQVAAALKAGERVVRTRFGVDEDVCSGDHSCIRLSGCPSLTVKDSADPLKVDPVAHVNNGCVGCGLCGEVAHAAILCPSFFRAEVVQNPGWWDRLKHRARATVIGWLQPA